MTERQVQAALWPELKSSSRLVVPNYTPGNWWPADLLVVTSSNYVHEYEIKLTAADFRRDADKHETRYAVELQPDGTRKRVPVHPSKHSLLASGSQRCPNRFWYVAPTGVIKDVPAWAGLKEITPHGKWLRFNVVKAAPIIHDTKACEKMVAHAKSVFYWRFWAEVRKNVALKSHLSTAK